MKHKRQQSNPFNSARCLILGANAGIGLALCEELLARGAQVVAASRHTKNLRHLSRTVRHPTNRFFTLRVEATSPYQLQRLFGFIRSHLNGLDYAFNTVGRGFFGSFLNANNRVIADITQTNLLTATIFAREAIRLFQRSKGPRTLIQIGSLAGIRPGHAGFSIYAASKEGLTGLYRSLDAEFRGRRIHCILVCPTGINTDFAKNSIGATNLIKKFKTSNLNEPREVAVGILEGLSRRLPDGDVRLFPNRILRPTSSSLAMCSNI